MRMHDIKLGFCLVGALFLISGMLMAVPQTDLVAARVHYAGGNLLVADSSVAKLRQIGAMPSTAFFRGAVLDKVSEKLTRQLDPAASNTVASWRPLLDDVVQCESVSVFGGVPDAPMEFALAIHLSPERASAWVDTITKINHGKGPLRVNRVGEWVVVARGEHLSAQENDYIQAVSRQGRPAPSLQGNWLEADADWARLAAWLPLEDCPFTLARTTISIANKGDDMKTKVVITYPQALPWKFTPWQIPTRFVHDPLVSFTAGQDVAPFLKPGQNLSRLSFHPFDGQFYVWAQDKMPFLTYGAIPDSHADNDVISLQKELPVIFNPMMAQARKGQFQFMTNEGRLVWTGLPMMTPSFIAVKEKSGKYLLPFLAVPPSGRGQQAPTELFQQFNTRTNVVYYDWELTAVRLPQWQQMAPFLIWSMDSMMPHRTPGGKKIASKKNPAYASKWLAEVGPMLGNTITEVERTAPNQLTLQRKSHLGLTGIELSCLSHWITEP